MPIVKSDKRGIAIKLLAETRAQLRGLLTQADALQATTEALELELGLGNEGEQSTRDQLLVLHYRKDDDTGHCLDECTEECAADESLDVLGEGETAPDKDDIGDGSGTGD
jgi:hypothetical protein